MQLTGANSARLQARYIHLGAAERQPDRFLHRQAQVVLVLADVAEDERDEGGVAHEGVALGEREDVLWATVSGELDGVLVLAGDAQDEAQDGVQAVGVADWP